VPGLGFSLLPHKYLLSYYTVLNSEGFKSVALSTSILCFHTVFVLVNGKGIETRAGIG
jgi:hypothetical protein